MKSFLKKIYGNAFVNIIGAIVLLLLLGGLIVSLIGYMSFTNSFKREYDTSTYHMADTAATLINGDHIDDYLNGRMKYEYRDVKAAVDAYCEKIAVSLVYVIKVDTSDYGSFVSVFNSVNNEVGNTSYTPWGIGYERETTNDEYRQKYKAIYEQEAEWEKVYRLKDLRGAIPHITTMVPIRNSAGDVVSILCIQRPISELNASRRPFLIKIAICTLLLSIFTSICYAGIIKRELAAPLKRVSGEARRFASEKSKGDSLNNISRFDDFKDLAASIETMETDMLSYMENLTKVTAEKERIGAELKLASTIQENAIPNNFPAFPDRTDFDIYASMDPAKEVGGDFYNFFLIDEDHLALVIGDVSGKGVPGALFMMVSNIILRDRTLAGGTPGEILTYVNKELCINNIAEMFVTLWLGIIDLKTGKMTCANAGHEFPAIMRAGGKFELFKDKHGFVVGGMDGIIYKDYELEFKPGDRIFVYTDGVPEATNASDELFGTDRMIEALNKDPGAKPQVILENVTKAVNGFVKEAEQFDDLTMLCFEWKGPER